MHARSTASRDDGRERFPALREQLGEDPSRFLSPQTNLDPTPRIRGIASMEVLDAWFSAEETIGPRPTILALLNERRVALRDDEPRTTTDSNSASDSPTTESDDDVDTGDEELTAADDAPHAADGQASDARAIASLYDAASDVREALADERSRESPRENVVAALEQRLEELTPATTSEVPA
jgi:hypothetical protein